MEHLQRHIWRGKRPFRPVLAVLMLFAVFTILCLTVPPEAMSWGSSSAPGVGTPPVGNAGWQARQTKDFTREYMEEYQRDKRAAKLSGYDLGGYGGQLQSGGPFGMPLGSEGAPPPSWAPR